MLVEELDALHDLFVEAIADGRSTSIDDVNANFGRGSTLLADEALKRGMIDAIEPVGLQSVKTTKRAASSGGNKEAKSMDIITLQASHPALYAEVIELGVKKERDRVWCTSNNG